MNDLLLPARLQAALGDAYLLERELGGGGMSRLFVATERSLNRQVVIKVLPPDLASEVSGARFKKEIEVAAQMLHPHIVPILAAGSGDGLLWYVMPYVRGESLRHRLREGGALPVREAVRILIEVADALAFAHRKGFVHRDIKPENILLEEGHAVLADFGVARAISAARTASAVDGANLTGTGMSVGTPTYMSPEQAAGESDVDARADIYALGIVGYEMLTGRHPFSGAGSAQSMMVAHLTEPAPPVAKLRADTPPAVNAAIARALAKLPDERFRTAEEFRDALDAAPTGARGSRGPLLAIGAAVVAMLVVVGIVATRRQHTGPLDQNLVAVAPFDVVDNDLKLWHEGMVDVLSRNLDGAGPLRTVSPTLVVRRWAGRADKESAAALGQGDGRAARGVRASHSLGRRLGARVGIRDGCRHGARAGRRGAPGRALEHGPPLRFADDRAAPRAREDARARRRANVVRGHDVAARAQGVSRGTTVLSAKRVGFGRGLLRPRDRDRLDVQHRAHARWYVARLGRRHGRLRRNLTHGARREVQSRACAAR